MPEHEQPSINASAPGSHTVAMEQLIDIAGSYPSLNDSGLAVNMMGMVHGFAGNFGTAGAAPCSGDSLVGNWCAALLSLIGIHYGGHPESGGAFYFTLPDLRDRVAVGGTPGRIDGQTLGLSYMIAATAAVPETTTASPGYSAPFPIVGAIGLFAGDLVPRPGMDREHSPMRVRTRHPEPRSRGPHPSTDVAVSGWLPADGSLVPISEYPALFEVIGTIYGGDGKTNFALPNLIGRAPVGAGQGAQASPIALGQQISPSANADVAGLGLTYMISMAGVYLNRESGSFPESDPAIGEVAAFAGASIPRGWAAANGQLLPINRNQALFSLLGTKYGGDGQTTFALPDLRGRMIVGRTDSRYDGPYLKELD